MHTVNAFYMFNWKLEGIIERHTYISLGLELHVIDAAHETLLYYALELNNHNQFIGGIFLRTAHSRGEIFR